MVKVGRKYPLPVKMYLGKLRDSYVGALTQFKWSYPVWLFNISSDKMNITFSTALIDEKFG